MKKLLLSMAVNLVAVVSLLTSMQALSEEAQPDREDFSLISVTEAVEAIDYENREVVLRNALGKTSHIKVGPEVKRLEDVKVGDTVTVDYFLSVAYELREPTEAELKQPLVELEETVKASSKELPGGATLRQIKAVCTIEGLDRPTETITLKGPRGNYALVQSKNTDNLPKLRIGQSVVVTYTEALAVSLQKL